MTSSHDLMSIGASRDVDRSVTSYTDRHTQTSDARTSIFETLYTIAPKGAIMFPPHCGYTPKFGHGCPGRWRICNDLGGSLEDLACAGTQSLT